MRFGLALENMHAAGRYELQYEASVYIRISEIVACRLYCLLTLIYEPTAMLYALCKSSRAPIQQTPLYVLPYSINRDERQSIFHVRYQYDVVSAGCKMSDE